MPELSLSQIVLLNDPKQQMVLALDKNGDRLWLGQLNTSKSPPTVTWSLVVQTT